MDGWRSEDFGDLGPGWEPMPWFFRTMESWVELLRSAGFHLTHLREPCPAAVADPLSLLLVAEPTR
jgi:hypothetical protein